ncbi:MAG: hypothetical protein VX764_05650 [Planctomycetota bacterium]|nr:hypothetical protein [Planctomycetota bacterium]
MTNNNKNDDQDRKKVSDEEMEDVVGGFFDIDHGLAQNICPSAGVSHSGSMTGLGPADVATFTPSLGISDWVKWPTDGVWY